MTRALVIKTYGDEKLSEAIVTAIVPPGLESEQSRLAAGVKAAVNNGKTASDYARLVYIAQRDYGYTPKRGPLYGAVWGLIGFIVLALEDFKRRGAR